MKTLRLLTGFAATAALLLAASCMRDRLVTPDAPLPAVLAVDRPTVQLFRFARGRMVVADTVRISNNGAGNLGPVQRLGGVDYQEGRLGWLDARIVNVDANNALLILRPTYADEEQDQADRAEVILKGEGAAELKRVAIYARTLPGAKFEFSVSPAAFTAAPGEPPSSQTLVVRNGGNGVLLVHPPTVEYEGAIAGWLSVVRAGGTETAPAFSVQATPGPLAGGLYQARLNFASPSGEETRALPAFVPVQLNVGTPRLGISTSKLAYSVVYGEPAPPAQTVLLSNVGAGSFPAVGKVEVASISYGAGGADWLQVTIDATRATAVANPAALRPGNYTASIRLHSEAGGDQTVQATLAIETPKLTLSGRTLSFGLVRGDAALPAAQAVKATNTGAGTLASLGTITVGAFAPAADWVSASVSGRDVTVTPTAAAGNLAVGTHSTRLVVTSQFGGADTLSVTMAVSRGVDVPALALSTADLTFSAIRGDPAPPAQLVRAFNAGGGTLGALTLGSITYTGATGWLVPTLKDTTVTVSVTPAGLPAGTHEATLRVLSQNGGDGSVRVVLTVASPVLTLSATSVSFSSQVDGSAGATRTITLSNTGPGSLATLGSLAAGPVSYQSGSGWLSAALSGTTLTLTLSAVPGSAGSYEATVPVTSTYGGSAQVSVALTVAAAPTAPRLLGSPVSVSRFAVEGGANPAAQTLLISNGGGGTRGSPGATSSQAWLTATVSGSTVTLNAASGSLPAGTHTATVTVSSNPGGSESVSVTLEVKAPRLTLSSASASFQAVQGSGAATPSLVPITLSNTGGGNFDALGTVTLGTVTYSGASGWLSAQLSGGNVVNLTATPGSLAAGAYAATVPVNSVKDGSADIQVAFTVTPVPAAPDLLVSPAAVNFSAETGGSNPASQSVTISNAGGGGISDLGTLGVSTITYGAGASGWLGRTLSGSTVTVSVTTGSLAAGTYSASFNVTSTAGGAAEPVTVQFTVFDPARPADLTLAAAQVEFAAVAGGANPAQRAVSIYNSGADRLGTISMGAITYGAGASGWLSTSDVSNSALTLKPVLGSIGGGTYTARVIVNSQYGGADTVDVTLRVGQPDLKLNPASAKFAAVAGGGNPSGQSILAGNAGAGTFSDLGTITKGTVTYGAGASGWLSASVNGSSIDLSVTTGSLAAGTYTATFPVTAANGGADETASVQFDVVADSSAATLALGNAQLEFAAVVGGADPAARTVAIFNRGTGDLGAISVGTITYGPGASGWLGASASSTQLTVTPTVGSLAAATYTATVPVNSANGGSASLAVTMVVGAPNLAVSTSAVSFAGTARGADPDKQVVLLSNAGAGTFASLGTVSLGTITYGAGASGWLSRTLSSSSLELSAAVGSLGAGVYTASFAVSSTAGGDETINVTFEVVPEAAPPLLSLAYTQVDFSAVVGSSSPAAKTVGVQNLGSGSLGTISVGTITYGPGASGWLGASASSSAITLTPSTGSLTAGTYTATVPVNSVNGGSTSVAVTLRVGVPDLTLSTGSVSFAATAGGSAPASQLVRISNAGAGTCDQLGTITLGSITYGPGASGWLTRNRTGADLQLGATSTGLAAGTYSASFSVSSTAGGSENMTVSITIAPTADAPVLALSATTVSFNAVRGAPAPAPVTISISNSGGGSAEALGTLSLGTIVYGSGSGWLGTPQIVGNVLTLTPVTSGLNEGSYSATVPVRSQSGGNQSLSVTLNVVKPVLTASALSLSFTALAGGSAPGGQNLTLSNTGGGTFADLGTLAVQSVIYGAGATGWLSSPRAATGIASSTVGFEVTPTGLAAGSYSAQVVLSSQYGGNQTVAVTLSIVRETDPARLVLSVPTLRFSALVGGANPEPQAVELANAGGGTLGSITVDNPSYGAGASGWLSASLGGTTVSVRAVTGTLAKGTYTASIPINSTGGGAARLDVTFVVGSPRITLTPRTVSFADTLGGAGPAPATVNVANTGGGTMESLGTISVLPPVYAGDVTGWLGAARDGTSGSITLTATTAGLAARPTPYEARVLVNSTYGGQDTVAVAFTVAPGGAPPRLSLSLDTLAFAGLIGQPNPAPQEVVGFNSGGGSLGALGITGIQYAGSATGWLTISIEGLRLIMTPVAASLAAGQYRARVVVASANGGSDSLQVVLDLGQPVLRLSTRAITFSDTVGSREILRSQVFLSNTGAGTRTDLGRIELGTVSYSAGATGWLSTTPLPGQTVDGFLASVETKAANVPEGTFVAKLPFRSQWGGTDTLAVTLSARRPDRSFDLPTIELVRTTVVNGAPVTQKLAGDSAVVTATARSAAQVALRIGVRNAADTRLTLSGLRVGMPTYTSGKSGWISGAFLDKTSATLASPAELFVAIEPATLDPGRYEAQLVVRSEAAGLAQVAPVTLRVVLVVQ
ncbi:MAG: choice-of-anchor D domain-containing protein [Gemmatimonadetes bacterium]|nr:choice-of-anchor D domain-containing protein [Gemmatimonadota bacterium]